MKLTYTLLSFLFLVSLGVNAQETDPTKPFYIGTIGSMTYVPSINSRLADLPNYIDKNEEAKDGRSSRVKVIPGKDPQTQDDYFVRNQDPLTQMLAGQPPSLVFDAYTSGSSPTDPSLAVGPDHVLVVFNTGFIVYDKAGVAQSGQMPPNPTIFPSGGCCDLTVSFDQDAQRWIVTFLGGGAQIAISDGTSTDPLATGWFVYNINQINDYQKLSVWSDGYYLTDNTGSSNKIWAMERDEMLVGNPSAQILGFNLPGLATSGFYGPQVLNVTDDTMPAAGGATVVFLQDDAYAGVTTDHLKVWTIDVDWVTPGNSTISNPALQITTTPFISIFDGGSFSNLAQPGGGADIDALQAIIMNQAQFRKFGGHNSAVFNFVIDTDATGGELAGVRWYELRQAGDNQPWTMFQEGTYTAPDGRHAWHASLMMDNQGNIGMGYTSMAGPTTPNPTDFRVSSYYTGRFAADPVNTMTIAEELIAAGNQNIPGLRYGDYSKIDIDPADDKTFWFINEYMNSGRKGVVGVFKIAPDFNNDVGAVSIDAPVDGILTSSESVDVTIFNFGLLPQSNFPVILKVDGSTIATETFTGTIAPTTSASFTFAATVDLSIPGQTYAIEVSTNLSGDQDPNNNTVIKNVTHVFANDIGVIDIPEPVSGEGLGNETVTITIENFGAAPQSNFDVSYTVDGGAAVTESVVGPIGPGATLNYSFATTADLSVEGSYVFVATTELPTDSDTSNDSATKTVVNLSCASQTNDTNFPIGPNAGTVTNSVISYTSDIIINDVNVNLNLNHTWIGDLTISLIAPDNTTVILADGVCGNCDDMIDVTFDDEATNPISGATHPVTGPYQPEGNLSDFDGMQTIGDWTLRIVDNANQDGGTLLDWTLQLCGDPILGVNDNFTNNTDLIVVDQGNNQFKLLLPTTEITDRLTFSVINMLGQTLASYRLDNVDGTGYEYDLDMSYASAGVYIVRIGNSDFGGVKRIIVR
ncbi:MAG: proprotein convertase P-domain-containing protein [Bacteroidetes bacterium]|nr:proprotein convertase P-domain-containing protein [Bacteroidota bacterium]